MAVPKNLPNREIWAKEAINTLPPLAATVPAPEPEPVLDEATVQAEFERAKAGVPLPKKLTRHK